MTVARDYTQNSKQETSKNAQGSKGSASCQDMRSVCNDAGATADHRDLLHAFVLHFIFTFSRTPCHIDKNGVEAYSSVSPEVKWIRNSFNTSMSNSLGLTSALNGSTSALNGSTSALNRSTSALNRSTGVSKRCVERCLRGLTRSSGTTGCWLRTSAISCNPLRKDLRPTWKSATRRTGRISTVHSRPPQI